MKLARRTNRLTAWIAIFAILLAALAPSVARALASPGQEKEPWSEICTLGGLQTAPDTAPASGSGQGTTTQHCLFCLNHHKLFVLPPVPCGLSLATEAAPGFIPPAVISPPPRFTGIAAEPRAPPAVS